MELANYMKKMSVNIQVRWSPWAGNQEADALANGNTNACTSELLIPIDVKKVSWNFLPWELDVRREADKVLRGAKNAGTIPKPDAQAQEKAT